MQLAFQFVFGASIAVMLLCGLCRLVAREWRIVTSRRHGKADLTIEAAMLEIERRKFDAAKPGKEAEYAAQHNYLQHRG